MHMTALVGGTVIDGTGAEPISDATVIVHGGRIRSVAAGGELPPPENATVVDVAGQYVIPGFMDANVHLSCPLADVLLEYEGRYDELVEEAAQLALRSGVTTVFDTWGHLDALTTVRDRIDHGEAVGSRIFVAGNIIGFDGPISSDFVPAGDLLGPQTVGRINAQWQHEVGADLMWLTPAGVRRRVRDYIERSGIDLVKYAASGHAGHRTFLTFSEATQRAIVEEAHRAGITAQAHTTTVESLRLEIEAGADILQHGNLTGPEPIPDEIIRTIVDKGLPVAALIHTKRCQEWIRANGTALIRLIYGSVQDENDQLLIDSGARLLLTTDGVAVGPRIVSHPAVSYMNGMVDNPMQLGESHFLWLEAVVERGMGPMEALLAATRNVAEAYRVSDQLGTIEPGKRADLVVLGADPLRDVRNYRRIVHVMKDGILVDRAALPVRRILTER